MIYLEWEKGNVHYLTCSYQELVKAFGQGSSNFDTDKQFAEWDIDTSNGVVEIYDYGYADSGDYDIELGEIDEWHVQGKKEAIQEMLRQLRDANR